MNARKRALERKSKMKRCFDRYKEIDIGDDKQQTKWMCVIIISRLSIFLCLYLVRYSFGFPYKQHFIEHLPMEIVTHNYYCFSCSIYQLIFIAFQYNLWSVFLQLQVIPQRHIQPVAFSTFWMDGKTINKLLSLMSYQLVLKVKPTCVKGKWHIARIKW